jgi:L-lactate dehydrogenase complex protein LldE
MAYDAMRIRAQLFITCLADQFFPETLKHMADILSRLGVECSFSRDQTCCGQPFFNTGFVSQAQPLARHWLDVFGGDDDAYIVAPSGSCVDFVRHHLPDLFSLGSPEHACAVAIADRTYEFSQFLVNVLHVVDIGARFPAVVTYHPSCHLLRGLGAREQAKLLLRSVRELEYVPLMDEETCCGFGGAFSVIFPEVSCAMMDAKIKNIEASGAQVVVACDAGCLMNIRGGLARAGSRVHAMHLIDLLGAEPNIARMNANV